MTHRLRRARRRAYRDRTADLLRLVFVVWAAAGRYSLRRRARTILRAAGFDVGDFSGIERHSLFAAKILLSNHQSISFGALHPEFAPGLLQSFFRIQSFTLQLMNPAQNIFAGLRWIVYR